MIHGSDLRDFATQLNESLQRAVRALWQQDETLCPESLLRLVPYSSILCVIELPPRAEDDDE